MNYLKVILKIFFAILFFQFNSCGLKIVENHGQVYEKNINFKELQVGKTKKDDVVELLGSPSTTSNFDDEQSWIYISSEFKKFIFLDGSNTDQKILILSFNQNTLKDKELLSRNDINNIEYEDTITDSKGKKINWIKEFFTNLNPDPYGKRK
jgi:outer membrane protein assembly factor BamE (lipoprotein component of BamABCDE complex)